MGVAVFQVEGVFQSDATDSGDRKDGVADGKGHPVAQLEAEVGGMDGGTRHLLEVQTDAVADARDVEVTEAGVDEDLSGRRVDSRRSLRPVWRPRRLPLAPAGTRLTVLAVWRLLDQRRKFVSGWRNSPENVGPASTTTRSPASTEFVGRSAVEPARANAGVDENGSGHAMPAGLPHSVLYLRPHFVF